MSEDQMITRWRGGKPDIPESYDDVAALVKQAKRVRSRIVEFDWEFNRDELERLRESFHFWAKGTAGTFKKFNALVVSAINEVLDESNCIYEIDVPRGPAKLDSEVSAKRIGDRYRLWGHANFCVVIGKGILNEPDLVRVGEELAAKLKQTIGQLGWDLNRLNQRELKEVLWAIYGLKYSEANHEGIRLESPTTTMELTFEGPFHWSKSVELPSLFDDPIGQESGVYLFTFPVNGMEHVHYVGQTKRDFATRLCEHLVCYLSGQYSILDPVELARGNQKIVWRTAWGAPLAEFIEQLEVIAPQIKKFLGMFRFHLALVEDDAQLRNRIEGGLGRHFQNHPDDQIRGVFNTVARLPGTNPSKTMVRCQLNAKTPIAGFPSELII